MSSKTDVFTEPMTEPVTSLLRGFFDFLDRMLGVFLISANLVFLLISACMSLAAALAGHRAGRRSRDENPIERCTRELDRLGKRLAVHRLRHETNEAYAGRLLSHTNQD